MAPSTVKRVLGSIPKYHLVDVLRSLLQTLFHLLRIVVSFIFLPLDNAILLATYFVGHLALPRSAANCRRQSVLRDVRFQPRTILVTGIDSPHGLAVARCWYYEGHRVIGADVTDLPVRSGESMSKTLAAFYGVVKSQYVSQLLDIIHREKADMWIPCSEQVDAMDEAVAKQVIEGRTDCRCIQLDPELASRFGTPESFRQFLVEKGLPTVENHQVQSRDSVHKILNRSPSKAYQMRRLNPAEGNKVLALPKRTLSLTYSEVSEIQISKDNPWILQQQTRLGEFVAELLVVRGYVKTIKIRPGDQQSEWGASRLDQGLAIAIHRLMDRFAMKGGPRMTGHLSVHLMVDEEFDANSVRHVLHIAGCNQDAAAAKTLLQDASPALASGYLAVLSPQVNKVPGELDEVAYGNAKTTIAGKSCGEMNWDSAVLKHVPSLPSIIRQLDGLFLEAPRLPFWKNARFSYLDPLPWWWHAHVYAPFREICIILDRESLKQA